MTDSNHGRIKILTSYELNGDVQHDSEIIPLILEDAMPIHDLNVERYNKFLDYFYNITEIQNKIKTARPDINNKVSFPFCETITETINSHCLSENPKCISNEEEKQEEMKVFNKLLDYDNTWDKLRKSAFYCGICGLSYRFIMKPNKNDIVKGKLIKTTTDINPKDCFCVYSNNIDREKVLGVIFYETVRHEIVDKVVKNTNVTVFNVFTKWHTFVFEKANKVYSVKPFNIMYGNTSTVLGMPYNFQIKDTQIISTEQEIPLIEYERNDARTSDFEKVIPLIDLLNRVASDSADAISQNVDYIFKMKNIDMGTFDENGKNEVLENTIKWLQSHFLSVNGIEGSSLQPDIDILEIPLDVQKTTEFQAFLISQIQEHTFIPNRNSGTGQDTGKAVNSRNGYRSLDDISSNIINKIIVSEKEYMEIALNYVKAIEDSGLENLEPIDIVIFPLKTRDMNINETANAFSTLINAGVDPKIAYQTTNLIPDYIEGANMHEEYRKQLNDEQIENEIKKQKELSKLNDINSRNTTNKVDGLKTE